MRAVSRLIAEKSMDARDTWQGRRVLVTGCTGFLGRAVTRELLDRGVTVAGLTRDPSHCSDFTRERDSGQFWPVCGRIEDRNRLYSAMVVHEVSAIFHFASEGTRGTKTVLSAAGLYHSQVPVIVARPSGQLRLRNGDEEPIEQPLGIARFGELIGSGDRKLAGIVSRTAMGLVKGEPATPTESRGRDFVSVRDAANACLLLAAAVGSTGESQDYTFRSGFDRNDSEMAKFVADVFAGKTVATEPPSELPENPLGWQAHTTPADAVREAIAWCREVLRTQSSGEGITPLRKVA
ncbi:MAG: NAD(P)-dependent oxidoreductase [Gemmataceae bacterium]